MRRKSKENPRNNDPKFRVGPPFYLRLTTTATKAEETVQVFRSSRIPPLANWYQKPRIYMGRNKRQKMRPAHGSHLFLRPRLENSRRNNNRHAPQQPEGWLPVPLKMPLNCCGKLQHYFGVYVCVLGGGRIQLSCQHIILRVWKKLRHLNRRSVELKSSKNRPDCTSLARESSPVAWLSEGNYCSASFLCEQRYPVFLFLILIKCSSHHRAERK